MIDPPPPLPPPPLPIPPPTTPTTDCKHMSSPPGYSPSTASPSYAVEPREGEQRLELVARPQPPTPQGTFSKRTNGVTVILSEQEPGVVTATYSRNAVIKGQLELEDAADLLSVTVKLEGTQVLSLAEGGEVERVLISEVHELWSKRGSASCSPVLGFYIPFPLNYVDDKGTHPLPPSFDAQFSSVPGLHARNAYSISVVVTKPRLGSWKKQKSLCIPINYHPRSRPYLPIPGSMQPFLSTVKTTPEEWRQVTTSIPYRDGSISEVDCHLFIPDVQIYALGDSIPFHLQLRGPAKSLRKFMGLPDPADDQPTRVISRNSDASSISLASSTMRWAAVRNPSTLFGALAHSAALHKQDNEIKPEVKVYLLRQISAKVKGQKAWNNVVLGEGKLFPLEHPPSWSPSAAERYSEGDHALDWEGEVRCNGDVNTASFIAGDLHVKDFIVVQLRPSNSQNAPLSEHQHAHPIRLVTDPYREAFSHPSDS